MSWRSYCWPSDCFLQPSVPPFVFQNHVLPCSCAVLQYEPEIFPGLIYRMKVPKVVLLIFVSGKVVLTGEGPEWEARKGRVAFMGEGDQGGAAHLCLVEGRAHG